MGVVLLIVLEEALGDLVLLEELLVGAMSSGVGLGLGCKGVALPSNRLERRVL